jgi:hypothetical protein
MTRRIRLKAQFFRTFYHTGPGTESINTQYMRNSNFVYILKMEYVPKINIFGLKIMVTIHHNFFFEIPPCAKNDLFITEFAILQLFMRQIHLIENGLRM